MNTLLDKQINIILSTDNGKSDHIIIPKTGIKPEISIQGKMVENTISDLSLRITNFYPSQPLNQYKTITIDAGYKSQQSKSTSGVDTTGEIFIAYQESSPPDGITYFQFLPCQWTDFINTSINIHFRKNTSANFSDLIKNVSNQIGLNIKNTVPDFTLQSSYDFNGSAKTFIIELTKQYNLCFRVDGGTLLIYPKDSNTGVIYNIEYISSPPHASAAGVTFNAPWVPALRPGDLISLNPKYYSSTYGGISSANQQYLKVLTIEFEFNTVQEVNKMTILALANATPGVEN